MPFKRTKTVKIKMFMTVNDRKRKDVHAGAESRRSTSPSICLFGRKLSSSTSSERSPGKRSHDLQGRRAVDKYMATFKHFTRLKRTSRERHGFESAWR